MSTTQASNAALAGTGYQFLVHLRYAIDESDLSDKRLEQLCTPPPSALRFLDGVPQQANLEEACSKLLFFENFRALPVRRRWSYSTRFDWHDIEVMTMTSVQRR